MNFYTAKRLLTALGMTIQRHEQTFGAIELDVRRRAGTASSTQFSAPGRSARSARKASSSNGASIPVAREAFAMPSGTRGPPPAPCPRRPARPADPLRFDSTPGARALASPAASGDSPARHSPVVCGIVWLIPADGFGRSLS